MEVTVDIKAHKVRIGDKVIAEVNKLYSDNKCGYVLEIKRIKPRKIVKKVFRTYLPTKVIIQYHSNMYSSHHPSTIIRVVRLLW